MPEMPVETLDGAVMSSRERLRITVSGGKPDRVPVSAWGHFFVEETDERRFVDATMSFHRRYGWDLLKVHSRASYHVEGWGFTYTPSTDPAKGHVCTGHPIREARDWAGLSRLALDAAPLAEQLRILERIRAEAGPDTPVIMTVFSPLDVAEKLIDRDAGLLKRHIEEDPGAVEAALAAMAETFAPFVRELARLGADGIYFSTKWANNVKLSPQQYQRLVRPYDLAVLEQARGMWCNVLHLCEDHVQLRAMADYPVQVFHWDTHAGHNPDFAQGAAVLGQSVSGKAVGGGVDPATLASGMPGDISAKAVAAIRQANGSGFLLAPGWSVQMGRTPEANLRALRAAPEVAASTAEGTV